MLTRELGCIEILAPQAGPLAASFAPPQTPTLSLEDNFGGHQKLKGMPARKRQPDNPGFPPLRASWLPTESFLDPFKHCIWIVSLPDKPSTSRIWAFNTPLGVLTCHHLPSVVLANTPFFVAQPVITTSRRSPSMAGELKTEQAIIAAFEQLINERDSLSAKTIELQAEQAEHELVIKTLDPQDASRKCFRLVGEVLVERTVGEVLPAVKKNRDNLAAVRRSTGAVGCRLLAGCQEFCGAPPPCSWGSSCLASARCRRARPLPPAQLEVA